MIEEKPTEKPREEIKPSEEQKLEERKQQIRSWLKDSYMILLLLLLVFAFFTRAYYFSLTKNQPLWWDEAEYMLKAKAIVFGTPETGWAAVRPIIFPYIASAFFFLSFGEIEIRIFMLILSLAAVFLTYKIGGLLFGKKTALIGSFIFSLLYLNLFYTFRLLTNIPELFVGLLALYLFILSYFSNKNYLYLLIPLFIFGFFLRFTIASYALVLFIFLAVSRELKQLKDRKFIYLLATIIILGLIAVFMSGKNIFSSFIAAFSSAVLARNETIGYVFSSYLKLIPATINTAFFVMFVIGLALYFYKYFMTLDMNLKKPLSDYSKQRLFVILWLLVSLIFYGLFVNHFEDRYILMIFPILSLVSAYGMLSLYELIKKYERSLAFLFVLAILIFGSYQVLKHSDDIIKARLTSYDGVRDAGFWLKQNSAPQDIVISSSVPQNTYYSERATFGYPSNESDFLLLIKEKKPRYMIISVFEKSPDWTYNWPSSNPGKAIPVNGYFADAEKKQVTLVIYEFNQSLYG